MNKLKLASIFASISITIAGCQAYSNAGAIKQQVAVIRQEAITAKDKATEVVNHLNSIIAGTGTVDHEADKQQQYQKLEDDLTKINNKWYVKTGRFIDRLFWTLIISYILLGIGSIILSITTGGVVGGFAEHLLIQVPFLPFKLIASFFKGKKE